MWDRTKDTMILTKLCFLWTLWLPDIVPQTCDEIPSLNADDVTILLPFTSHSWHQPQVSSDHKKWRMNHCFLQTHNCNWALSCCRWGLAACSHHGILVATHPQLIITVVCGSSVTQKMFTQEPDDWMTLMMTWGWSLVSSAGSWCTEGQWYPVQGTLPLHAASLTGV